MNTKNPLLESLYDHCKEPGSSVEIWRLGYRIQVKFDTGVFSFKHKNHLVNIDLNGNVLSKSTFTSGLYSNNKSSDSEELERFLDNLTPYMALPKKFCMSHLGWVYTFDNKCNKCGSTMLENEDLR